METDRVRRLVLTAHAAIAELADDVDNLALHALRDPALARSALERRLIELFDTVATHMDLEDRLLRPTLRGLDAWGDARVERMDQDHREQRATIGRLRRVVADCRGRPSEVTAIARTARAFVIALRQDMTDEERDMLSPELFRHDLVAVDQDVG